MRDIGFIVLGIVLTLVVGYFWGSGIVAGLRMTPAQAGAPTVGGGPDGLKLAGPFMIDPAAFALPRAPDFSRPLRIDPLLVGR